MYVPCTADPSAESTCLKAGIQMNHSMSRWQEPPLVVREGPPGKSRDQPPSGGVKEHRQGQAWRQGQPRMRREPLWGSNSATKALIHYMQATLGQWERQEPGKPSFKESPPALFTWKKYRRSNFPMLINHFNWKQIHGSTTSLEVKFVRGQRLVVKTVLSQILIFHWVTAFTLKITTFLFILHYS